MPKHRQQGFSLIAAIFLITVLAALGAFLVTMSGVLQHTPVLGHSGAQAYHAARSGLEWGISRAINSGGGSQTVCDGVMTLGQYNVTVTCGFTTHVDDGTNVDIYVIDAVAVTGTAGGLDFASRRLHATVSPSGPLP